MDLAEDCMRLRHIEVFHAIKQTGSIGKAAALLGVSQPAVSKVLKHAEASLGFKLFDRVKGRLQPTVEAEALHVEVTKLHQGLEQLRVLSANLRRFPEGRLRIGCLPSLGLSIMPKAIYDFRRKCPKITCDVETDHIDALVASLRGRNLDLAVTLFPSEHPGIRMQTLGETELVYLGPEPGEEMRIEAIESTKLVGLSRRDKIGELFAFAFEAAGGTYTPSIEVQTYFMACAFATAGCGAAVVDALTARAMRREGLFVKRIVPRIPIELALLVHENHIAREFYSDFVKILKSAIGTRDGRLLPS
jgi:DNA-binding transcriptional LysR family regulator